MIFFLTGHSLWLSGVVIIGLGTALATVGPAIVRRRVSVERLAANNEIAGFKFATVGVLYAVLLAFSIIVVWQKYSDAETTVAQEAGAAELIYWLSAGIAEQPRAALRNALTAYLTRAINNDWPAMERGAPDGSRSARQALDAIYATLPTFASAGQGDAAIVSEILRQLDLMTQARRVRLVAAEGAVPGAVWLILFGGAAVTIGFTFFFGAESSAGADADDGAARVTHLRGAVHHRRHRPAVHRHDQSGAECACRSAGGFRAGGRYRRSLDRAAITLALDHRGFQKTTIRVRKDEVHNIARAQSGLMPASRMTLP